MTESKPRVMGLMLIERRCTERNKSLRGSPPLHPHPPPTFELVFCIGLPLPDSPDPDTRTLSGWSHVTKKAPLTTVNFLLPVTGGHSGRNGKRACFFPVIFRSFESLSVVTDGQTDTLIQPTGGENKMMLGVHHLVPLDPPF
jgi:hypothetical protein